jgi:hypothetical protein
MTSSASGLVGYQRIQICALEMIQVLIAAKEIYQEQGRFTRGSGS